MFIEIQNITENYFNVDYIILKCSADFNRYFISSPRFEIGFYLFYDSSEDDFIAQCLTEIIMLNIYIQL